MNLVKEHQKFIESIVQTYLRRFKIFPSGDFLQDVLLNILERESEIIHSFQEKNKNKVPFKSYLARTVWNECIDLGKNKYARLYQDAVNHIDISSSLHLPPIAPSQEEEEEDQEHLLQRIQQALDSKRLKKNKRKIELFLNLKKGSNINREELEKCFPDSPQSALQMCLKKLKNAKNETQKYQAIAQISGKNHETEQRWFNYQLTKIREYLNNRIL